MSIRRIVLPAVAAATLIASGASVAAATGGMPGIAGASTRSRDGAQAGTRAGAQAAGSATFLAASLNGRNEVPAPGGPAVGDRDGKAIALIRVQGDRLWYALRWQNIAAPSAGHLHLGAAGTNGAVKVPFFGGALPGTARAVTGSVKVADKAALDKLRTDPGALYANIHTGEFPGGAVRGQLHRLSRPADLDGVLNGESQATLQSEADGAQEIPAADGKAAGDPDGHAAGSARSHDGMVSWGFSWSSVAPPTLGHIHNGARGANGPVVADLFAAPSGLPASVTGLAGMSQVGTDAAQRIMSSPRDFYTNLHTAEFPGGAVRGQLAPAASRSPRGFVKAVVAGAQIYRCTRQQTGGFAFTQDNVGAVLERGIRHTFAQPGPAGPPQWVAADGSAVTGKAVTKTPNGTGNIPELVLDATQTGTQGGLLSGTTQILRLNTVGGVAPSGPCNPTTQPFARAPYKADYVFFG
ncbi:CHRD domain-containing protein [Actinomadura rubrisoli]|uniref:CHRD domain-containing protein n=1 Tax=Actinomadura rubrisoli TaxID=2530368 RepID=A0A4V2YWB2_9ACTN|nr:CHRD domain-containing protein [Actinomadura rubrisoli]TDD84727.1 CHRD domain-containing protein [Actinomadura rubrisoli]